MPYRFTFSTRHQWASIVRRFRARHRMSQRRLARELKLAVSTIQRWEYAEHLPDPISLKRLERLEGVLQHGKAE